MKRKILFFLIALLSSVTTWAAVGDDIKDGGLWYKVTSESPKEIKVYKYDGKKPTGDLTIPAAVSGYSVTDIADKAFDKCNGLTGITIPDGVKTIGRAAFGTCLKLKTASLPASLTSIGNNAFNDCEALTSVNIPDGVKSIGKNAFYCCFSLTSINIPDGVTSIEDGTFAFCESLTSIDIPASVTSIGENAFNGCKNVTSVVLGSGLKKIGKDAFNKCSGVTDVYCYADLLGLTWNDAKYSFKSDGTTVLHLTEDLFKKWNEEVNSGEAVDNFNFNSIMGNLYGDAPLKVNSAVPGEYWTTFYNSINNVRVTDGTTAFKGALGESSVTLMEVADGIINANQAVILKSISSSIPLLLSETTSASSYEDNGLQGVSETTVQIVGNSYYVLSDGSKGVGFYKLASDKSLAANKAFFVIEVDAGVREFFEFEEATTAIREVKEAKIGKMKSVDTWYTLEGHKLQTVPTHPGIYIHNGNKEAVQ